jgi:hypothetical protein
MIAAFDAAHPTGGYVPKAERVEVTVVEDEVDRLADAIANVSHGDTVRITLSGKTHEVEARLVGGSLWVGQGNNAHNLATSKGWTHPELTDLVVL